jgi:hypothetical protein
VNKIKAYRDGQERYFSEIVWEAMGIGHCGWKAVPEVPKEVLAPVVPKEVAGLVDEKSKYFKPVKKRR